MIMRSQQLFTLKITTTTHASITTTTTTTIPITNDKIYTITE